MSYFTSANWNKNYLDVEIILFHIFLYTLDLLCFKACYALFFVSQIRVSFRTSQFVMKTGQKQAAFAGYKTFTVFQV